MFSTLRNRFGIPGVISVIALVFAMIGGAYAASNSSSSKDASASAKKALKGPRGPKGAKGATGDAGPVGPQGPAGANGKDGSNGAAGADGKSVASAPIAAGDACGAGITGVKYTLDGSSTNVCNGAKGAEGNDGAQGATGLEGPAGEPWTVGGTLPPGETLAGAYSATVSSTGTGYGAISFPIPLVKAIPSANIHLISENETLMEGVTLPVGCSKINDEFLITPDPNHMCVFMNDMAAGSVPLTRISSPLEPGSSKVTVQGATAEVTGTEGQFSIGTWAVTAPIS